VDLGTDPNRVEEHYQLQSVNGRPLPYTLAEVGDSRLRVVRGYVGLRANGHFTHSITLEAIEPWFGDFASTIYPLVESGTWVRDGRNFLVSFSGEPLLGVFDEAGIGLQQTVRGVSVQGLDEEVVITPTDYSLSLVFRR
jgi:hypothetical protein